MLQHLETFLGVGIDGVGHQQVAVGPPVAPAHPAAQLVQLRQAEPVGVVHHHRVGVGHVEPRLHDHGGDQDVHLAGHEPAHHLLQVVRRHLAVGHPHPGPGGERLHLGGDGVDGLDPVVDHEHLAAAVDLPGERLLQQSVVPRLDEGQDGRAVAGRGLDQGQVAKPCQREMERARESGWR